MVDVHELIDELINQLNICEGYLAEKAHTNQAYNDVLGMSEKELPLHINDVGLVGELVSARLKGESIDTPEWHCRAMYDLEFSMEEYKNIGTNDGALGILSLVFSRIDRDDLAKRATAAMYNAD